MSPEEPHRWHCDYVRLAWDAGFSFATRAPPQAVDKTNLALLDVEHVVRERDVASVERHIGTILRYTLEESAALDATFVKVFRLAQLAIEYLLFCKRYLDGCVAGLKSDCSRQNEEIADLRARLEAPPPSSSRRLDLITTFKCDKCPKLFSSPEYLDSHVRRRHAGCDSTDRLHTEIKELKERLNATEKSLSRAPREEFEDFKREIEGEMAAIRAKYEGRYDKLVGLLEKRKGTDFESTHTQTETEPVRRLVKTTVHCIDLCDRTDEVEDRIEAKISSGLLSIERRLEDFSETLRTSLEAKPQVKPRTKFSIQTSKEPKPDENTATKPDQVVNYIEPDETVSKPDETAFKPDETEPLRLEFPIVKAATTPEKPLRTTHESESEEILLIAPSVNKPKKRRIRSSKAGKRLPLSVSVNNVLRCRSDAVGGPTSLSESTLLRALRIMGRSVPGDESSVISPTKGRKVLKVRYKRASKENDPLSDAAQPVTIRNRSLYDTTDSEVEPKGGPRVCSDSDLTTAPLSDCYDYGGPAGGRVREKKKVLFDVRVAVGSSSD